MRSVWEHLIQHVRSQVANRNSKFFTKHSKYEISNTLWGIIKPNGMEKRLQSHKMQGELRLIYLHLLYIQFHVIFSGNCSLGQGKPQGCKEKAVVLGELKKVSKMIIYHFNNPADSIHHKISQRA